MFAITILLSVTSQCPVTIEETAAFLGKYMEMQKPEDLKSMTELTLANKCLNDDDLKYLCPLTELKSLSIYNDNCEPSQKLTGSKLDSLSSLQKLEFLDLDSNAITADKLGSLEALQSLKMLKLYNNRLSVGSGLHRLADIPQLETVILDRNQLTDTVFKELRALCGSGASSSRGQMLNIRLAHNNISGQGLVDFEECSRDLNLDLSNTGYQIEAAEGAPLNKIDLAALAELPPIRSLKVLSLNRSLVIGPVVPMSARFFGVELEALSLSSPRWQSGSISTEWVEWLQKLFESRDKSHPMRSLYLESWGFEDAHLPMMSRWIPRVNLVSLFDNKALSLQGVSSLFTEGLSPEGIVVPYKVVSDFFGAYSKVQEIQDAYEYDSDRPAEMTFAEWLKAQNMEIPYLSAQKSGAKHVEAIKSMFPIGAKLVGGRGIQILIYELLNDKFHAEYINLSRLGDVGVRL